MIKTRVVSTATIRLLKLDVDFTAIFVASGDAVVGLREEAAAGGCRGDAVLKDCDSLFES